LCRLSVKQGRFTNLDKNFDAALAAPAPSVSAPVAPSPTILCSKPTVFKRTKVNIGIGTISFYDFQLLKVCG
jgi:hypothetical protein